MSASVSFKSISAELNGLLSSLLCDFSAHISNKFITAAVLKHSCILNQGGCFYESVQFVSVDIGIFHMKNF